MSDNLQEAAEAQSLDLLIGDVPIARFVFGDAAKRKLIPRLMGELPIFELLGKRAARRSQLSAAIAARERAVAANKGTTTT
jgi:hypothetical protein